MPPALAQELIDLIVDAVHGGARRGQRRDWANILALLRTARCFGARCRKHLYHTVSIDLEITPSGHLDKTLDASSLRFVELVRHTPSLAGLVKNVCYGLYFELSDPSSLASTSAWHTLREIAPYLTRLNSVELYGYDSREIPQGFCLHLHSTLVKAIGEIIPGCPFRKLGLDKLELLPIHLVDLLAYCPHVVSLDINAVFVGYDYHGENSAARLGVSSQIEELVVGEADTFLCEMTKHDACRTLVASTRRLVFASWDQTEHVWTPLGEFIPQLKTLETVYFYLDDDDTNLDVRAFLHAPALCLEMYYSANLLALSDTLMQNPSYPSNLRRVAIIVHKFDDHIVEWRKLASVLHQPRFAALETVCITFSRRSEETPHSLEDVSRCFADFKAKVNVRQLVLPLAVHTYFDTLF